MRPESRGQRCSMLTWPSLGVRCSSDVWWRQVQPVPEAQLGALISRVLTRWRKIILGGFWPPNVFRLDSYYWRSPSPAMYIWSFFVRHIAFLLSRLTAMPIVLSFRFYIIIFVVTTWQPRGAIVVTTWKKLRRNDVILLSRGYVVATFFTTFIPRYRWYFLRGYDVIF